MKCSTTCIIGCTVILWKRSIKFQGNQSISWVINEFIHFFCSPNKHFSFNYLTRDRTAQLSVLKCEKKEKNLTANKNVPEGKQGERGLNINDPRILTLTSH